MTPDLSIVIPTCDRADRMSRCLWSVFAGTDCAFEVIVIDGASRDCTPTMLSEWPIRVITERKRKGFVRAVNTGFKLARGRCVTWLNDDTQIMPGALDAAVEQADADDCLVAMYHRWDKPKNVAYRRTIEQREYQLCHVRGTLYANFGLGRRQMFEQLGYFDERYYFYGADPDFSLKVWSSGRAVVPGERSFVDHEQHADDRRTADAARADADNRTLFDRWKLPPVNPDQNDFDPSRPCTLRYRARSSTGVAA